MAVLERPTASLSPRHPDPARLRRRGGRLARLLLSGLRRAPRDRNRLPGRVAVPRAAAGLERRWALPTPGISHWVPDAGRRAGAARPDRRRPARRGGERWPDHEAVVYSAYEDLGIEARWSFAELRERARAGRPGADRLRDRAGRAGRDLGDQRPRVAGAAVRRRLRRRGGRADEPALPRRARSSSCSPRRRRRPASSCPRTAARACGRWPSTASAEPRPRARSGPDRRRAGRRGRRWEEWLAGGDAVDEDRLERRRRAVRAGDTSQIQFTSGTTGFPKGAELTPRRDRQQRPPLRPPRDPAPARPPLATRCPTSTAAAA